MGQDTTSNYARIVLPQQVQRNLLGLLVFPRKRRGEARRARHVRHHRCKPPTHASFVGDLHMCWSGSCRSQSCRLAAMTCNFGLQGVGVSWGLLLRVSGPGVSIKFGEANLATSPFHVRFRKPVDLRNATTSCPVEEPRAGRHPAIGRGHPCKGHETVQAALARTRMSIRTVVRLQIKSRQGSVRLVSCKGPELGNPGVFSWRGSLR